MRHVCLYAVLVILSGGAASSSPPAPLADHHQHLFSPGIAALISADPIGADDLVRHLDAAGITRAVVLSCAYMYGRPSRTIEHEYEKVKAENDWTSQQVARFPDRLRGFCSVNPLKGYRGERKAVQHLQRQYWLLKNIEYAVMRIDEIERQKQEAKAAAEAQAQEGAQS